jgi:hypothetical protein
VPLVPTISYEYAGTDGTTNLLDSGKNQLESPSKFWICVSKIFQIFIRQLPLMHSTGAGRIQYKKEISDSHGGGNHVQTHATLFKE